MKHSYTDISFDESVHSKIKIGLEKLSKAVRTTLGPKGKNVIIDSEGGAPVVTKDGVTVARSVVPKDKHEYAAVKVAREAAQKTADNAGDGTTTSIVLIQAFYENGHKYIVSGNSPIDIARGMEMAREDVQNEINAIKKDVVDDNDILQIATISANNDEALGSMIAGAIKKIGNDGVITLDMSKTFETHVEIVEGMQWDRGYVSPYFVTHADKETCELSNPYILIANKRLESAKEVLNILEFVSRSQRPLFIIAEDILGDMLGTLVVNKMRNTLTSCAVRAPSFGDMRAAILDDIAITCGGKVFDNMSGKSMETIGSIDPATPRITEDVNLWLGSAEKVVIEKDCFTIFDGGGDKVIKEKHIADLKKSVDAQTKVNDVVVLQKRIAKLANGIALIKVGGNTETERGERHARIDDAVHATKAAIEFGVVPGGGMTLFRISKKLSGRLAEAPENRKWGYKAVLDALTSPLYWIAKNAGYSLNAIQANFQDNINSGFDANNGVHCDMIAQGIIDPAKVTMQAVNNAISAATMLLMTDCMIIEQMDDETRNNMIDPSKQHYSV